MTVGEGKFLLYSSIQPVLEAGDYRFIANQDLTASGPHGALGPVQLTVDELATHVRVRSPRYQLPPDQVLSTFPPANSEGSYGMRLPQVVIKRRTLPWERLLDGQPRSTPWLALVLIAEGEAELKLNQKVADCVTPGTVLPGLADSELGNYLSIHKSMIDRIFPTKLDVPLLAHAREVDIHDTELMMGDDDGFLAVVISNRLPLPGTDVQGHEVGVKYLACLVNLEGQFDALLPKAPEPVTFTFNPLRELAVAVDVAGWDHLSMGRVATETHIAIDAGLHGAPADISSQPIVAVPSASAATFDRASQWTTKATVQSNSDVYAEMAVDFATVDFSGLIDALNPTYRFPVLLHWSFTSAGSTTFRSLMEGLDSGLLGTTGATAPDDSGRRPMEVVETGHVGLAHRTRRGDSVRSWYRGPFVAHPTADPPTGRLALAHASDQLRIVVPDGREDLSLAAAFEIGRLLALSRPAMVAALLRWRQGHYQTARRQVIWEENSAFVKALLGIADEHQFGAEIGMQLGRGLTGAITTSPETFLGDPRVLVDAGRPLDIDASVASQLAAGFALPEQILSGDRGAMLARLRAVDPVVGTKAGGGIDPKLAGPALRDALDHHLARLVSDTVTRGTPTGEPDALDHLLDRLSKTGEGHG